jgi:hypothetical protein
VPPAADATPGKETMNWMRVEEIRDSSTRNSGASSPDTAAPKLSPRYAIMNCNEF